MRDDTAPLSENHAMPSEADLLPLDAVAAIAFPGGGVTAKTLRLRARQGLLTVYRPGKAYLTTLADVRAMVAKCRVDPKARGCGLGQSEETNRDSSPTNQLGLSSKELASAALDAALAIVPARKRR
jgi:hypothetical protein